jgi:hypothetical protein
MLAVGWNISGNRRWFWAGGGRLRRLHSAGVCQNHQRSHSARPTLRGRPSRARAFKCWIEIWRMGPYFSHISANEILIPLSLLFLLAWIIFLLVRSRRIARANAQSDHRPHSSVTANDPKDIARSIGHGQGTGGNSQ